MFQGYPPRLLKYENKEIVLISGNLEGWHGVLERKVLLRKDLTVECGAKPLAPEARKGDFGCKYFRFGGLFSVEGELFVVRRGSSFLYYNFSGQLEKEVQFKEYPSTKHSKEEEEEVEPENLRELLGKKRSVVADVSPDGKRIATASDQYYWAYDAVATKKGLRGVFYHAFDNPYGYQGYRIQFLNNKLTISWNDDMLIAGQSFNNPDFSGMTVEEVVWYWPLIDGRVAVMVRRGGREILNTWVIKIFDFNIPSLLEVQSRAETVAEFEDVEDIDFDVNNKIQIGDVAFFKFVTSTRKKGEERETEEEVGGFESRKRSNKKTPKVKRKAGDQSELGEREEGEDTILFNLKLTGYPGNWKLSKTASFENEVFSLTDGTEIRDPKVPTVPVLRSESDKILFSKLTPLNRDLSDIIHGFLVGNFKVKRDFMIASDLRGILKGKIPTVLTEIVVDFWIVDFASPEDEYEEEDIEEEVNENPETE